jgi:hypothetical protein
VSGDVALLKLQLDDSTPNIGIMRCIALAGYEIDQAMVITGNRNPLRHALHHSTLRRIARACSYAQCEDCFIRGRSLAEHDGIVAAKVHGTLLAQFDRERLGEGKPTKVAA